MSNSTQKILALLPDEVINKIAAGEVVERPASIVRELVDNAIDAGARSVTVEVRDGGQTMVRVTDDGAGMSALDAELCFKRHATSKIKSVFDLEEISSLGFRGEALSSIAAVSEVRLKTRQADSDVGTEIFLREGTVLSNKACGCAKGADFEVSKLFANLPARRKFLKSPRSDFLRIQEWLYQSCLANPTVRYRFISDGREIFRLSEKNSIFERLETLIDGSTIRIDFKAGPFSARGLIAHPSQAAYKVGNFGFLLNGRPVQDKMLMKCLRDAWSTGLRPGEYPVGALEISLPASEVDINVHPQKSEVRFRNSQAVFGSVYKAIKSGLSDWTTKFKIEPSAPAAVAFEWSGNSAVVNDSVELTGAGYSSTAAPQRQFELYDSAVSSLSGSSFITERYIGQILGVFLIFERANSTFLVDAHAAHERIRYNELLSWSAASEKTSQRLLLPEKVELAPSQLAHLLEKKSELESYGFLFEVSGNHILITEMPSALKKSELIPFIECIAESEVKSVASSLQKIVEKTLARSACRSSVMSGVRLGAGEAEALWNQIKREPHGAVCPHGRPVMVELSREEIDKMFFRDGF